MVTFNNYIQKRKNKNRFKFIIFLTIFLLLKSPVKSFKYFKAFNILSNDLLLISDEGIIKYNTESDTQNLVVSSNLVSESNLEYITFSQFPSNEGGYIICRINEYIYILSEDATVSYGKITLEEIKDQHIELITYTTEDLKKFFIICYINNVMKITTIMHEINLVNFESSEIKYQNWNIITYEDGSIGTISLRSIGCKIINVQTKQNILTCFVSTSDNLCMNAISFDQDNNFTVIDISKHQISNNQIALITVDNSPNKRKSLVCYHDNGKFLCTVYNSETKEWSNIDTELENCNFYQYNRGLKYINDEYFIYCYNSIEKVTFFKLDEEFSSIQFNDEGKCFFNIQECYQIFTSSIVFNKNQNKYSLLFDCSYSNGNVFRISNINNTCHELVKEINISLSNSQLPKTNSYSDNLNYIDFYEFGDIIKGRTNKTKEDIENNLDEIIDEIEIGERYEIEGNDYNIKISPVNLIDTFNSTYVEFSICEQILRNQNKIPENEVLTILQIEIDKLNCNSLTNQVEYAIYNGQKIKLDLSYCKNVNIKVYYEINDPSLINTSMVSYYSELGIDIYNSKDSFFNDICYSYSNTDTDIILKDRVLDIYQNYSLCDNYCEYEEIDIELMIVKCSCKVKTKVNVEISEPIFVEIIEDSFKDSNFGIIFCYNLVFSLENKLKNIGLWIFGFFILCNIILFIIFFIVGIKSIRLFVYKEMRKHKYIAKLEHSSPLKKNKKVKFENVNLNKGDSLFSSQKYNILKENIQKEEKGSFEKFYRVQIKRNTNRSNKTNNNVKKVKIVDNPITIVKLKNRVHKYKNKFYESAKNFSKNNKNENEKNIISFNLETKRKIIESENNTLHKNEIEEDEDKQKCPGYYHLIQIDASNQKNNAPPESKYILDNYDYECAIEYEKRSFCRIYYICLLSYENILNTFFFKSSLEIKPLKLTLFIFSYLCDLALNGLFYFNENISDRYHYNGNNLFWFTLLNNLTIDLTSSLVSYILVKLLDFLIDSKESIEDLFRKHEKKMRKNKKYKVKNTNIIKIYQELKKIYKILKIKIAFYIIFEFLFLLFFLYYITAFCEVYKNTQISWLYDSFISFLISIGVEFFISFLVAIFYIISVKCRFRIMYKIVIFFYGLG